MTSSSLLQKGTSVLTVAGIESPRRIARLLLSHILEISTATLIASPDRELSRANKTRFQNAISRAALHEPLQYIVGYADFYGLRLHVSTDTLIPRPETEILVDVALSFISSTTDARVLDIGTGSGCIAVAIKLANPSTQVVACDISGPAIEIAKMNAETHGVEVEFFQTDITAPPKHLFSKGRFDFVISNPPYIPENEISCLPANVRDYEPRNALSCGSDPLSYYRAIAGLRSLLRNGGTVIFEAHSDYAHEVKGLLLALEYTDVKLLPDLAGLPRVICARSYHPPVTKNLLT